MYPVLHSYYRRRRMFVRPTAVTIEKRQCLLRASPGCLLAVLGMVRVDDGVLRDCIYCVFVDRCNGHTHLTLAVSFGLVPKDLLQVQCGKAQGRLSQEGQVHYLPDHPLPSLPRCSLPQPWCCTAGCQARRTLRCRHLTLYLWLAHAILPTKARRDRRQARGGTAPPLQPNPNLPPSTPSPHVIGEASPPKDGQHSKRGMGGRG